MSSWVLLTEFATLTTSGDLEYRQLPLPGRLGISTRMVILIRTHTKKYTKGDSIKKFFAGYVGWLTRTICTKIGDNWINGTGNIDRFVFPTPSLLENKMRKNVFSVQKWLIWGENKRIFPGGMNKITFHQLNQRFSVSISVRRELPIGCPLILVLKIGQFLDPCRST